MATLQHCEEERVQTESLQHIEWELRIAQANDSLEAIRSHFHVQSSLYHYKDRFAWGQRALTRSQNLLKRSDDKIQAAALRYRVA